MTDKIKTIEQLESFARLFDPCLEEMEDDKIIYFYNLGINKGIRLAINFLQNENSEEYQNYVKDKIKELNSKSRIE